VKKHYSVLLWLVTLTLACQAKSTSKQFDELLNESFPSDGPGGVVLVVKEGNTIYRKAFGLANLELNVEMKPEHIFRIGSITKQFTAAAILQLVEAGKINLDADITEYINDYPTHGHSITVKHLLNHTSGIKSYTGMTKWNRETRKKDFTPIELIDYFKSEPMDFAPGEQFKYNNSGYVLLGHLIEQVSGKTYTNYIQSHIFKPLNMNSSFYGSTSRIIKNRVSGYNKTDGQYINADYLSMTQPYAGGALLSTADDINTWYQAMMNDQVITQKSRVMAHQMSVLNSGKKIDYGFGWRIKNIQGSPMIEHGGGINGFLSTSLFLPEESIFVVVLSNCTCNFPRNVANRMAAIAMGSPFKWERKSLDEKLLKKYVGVYEKNTDDVRVITYENGNLYSLRTNGQKNQIHAFSKDHFFFEDSIVTLVFNRDFDGVIQSVTLKSTVQDLIWVKTN